MPLPTRRWPLHIIHEVMVMQLLMQTNRAWIGHNFVCISFDVKKSLGCCGVRYFSRKRPRMNLLSHMSMLAGRGINEIRRCVPPLKFAGCNKNLAVYSMLLRSIHLMCCVDSWSASSTTNSNRTIRFQIFNERQRPCNIGFGKLKWNEASRKETGLTE